jgi:hypothetical protein
MTARRRDIGYSSILKNAGPCRLLVAPLVETGDP